MRLMTHPPQNTEYMTGFWKKVSSEFHRRQLELQFYLENRIGSTETMQEIDADAGKPVDWVKFFTEFVALPLHGKCKDNWVVDDVKDAHALLFRDSMKCLKLEGASEEKRDVLAWVFAPDMQPKLIRGKLHHVHVSDIPFSFYRCAREYGIVDVDLWREEMLRYMDPDLVQKLQKLPQKLH